MCVARRRTGFSFARLRRNMMVRTREEDHHGCSQEESEVEEQKESEETRSAEKEEGCEKSSAEEGQKDRQEEQEGRAKKQTRWEKGGPEKACRGGEAAACACG